MVPSDFHQFPNLKKHLTGEQFTASDAIMAYLSAMQEKAGIVVLQSLGEVCGCVGLCWKIAGEQYPDTPLIARLQTFLLVLTAVRFCINCFS